MIIDFHTHIFPEQVAPKMFQHVKQMGHFHFYSDGTLGGLKRSMKESGVTHAVVLPVCTKPEQFPHMNDFAQAITREEPDEEGLSIISFGGIHPDSSNYKEELRIIKDKGLKGLKLHPYDQRTYINDIKYERIIDCASELDLLITIHCGLDPRFPGADFGATKFLAQMLRNVSPKNVILAHMGGFSMANEAEELLIGGDYYMDLAAILRFFPPEQLLRMCRNHGIHKILFGSDLPWSGQKVDLEYIRSLDFTQEELSQILYRNGAQLLGLPLSE